jgi:predicted amidohydrolase
MKPFSIAAIQMRILPQDNVERLCTRVELALAAFPWIQMVVLSELASLGPGLHHAQPLPSPIEDRYRRLAAQHQIWLIPGSLYERLDGLVYNTTPVISPDGTVVARYRKMFPFTPYELGVTPGTEFVVFDVPEAGRFGLSICYDMWFPETTRTLAAMGAEVILHPSLTPTIDRDVELAIARAAAATNQVYVFDVNGLEAGGNGRSVVVDPTGAVLYQAGEGPQIIPLEIDFDLVRRGREAGLRGLGQPLKSFRDQPMAFSVYDPKQRDRFPFLESLGPVQKPHRGSLAGLDRKAEAAEAALAETWMETGEEPPPAPPSSPVTSREEDS